MISMRLAVISAFTAFLVAGSTPTAAAQSSITQTDIQRLENAIYDTARDVTQLRNRDATLANRLQTDLDDARDEAIYLKVKLRKNETVTRSDYRELSDRIDTIRAQARGDSTRSSSRDSSRESGISDSPSTANR